MGTLEALKLMISGGWIAGGRNRRDKLTNGDYLSVCQIETGSRLKINLHHGDAVVAGRFNVLDIIDERRKSLLVRRGQSRLDIFWIEPGVRPRDRDHWDIDIGKDVGGRAENHGRAQQENEQSQDDKGIRSIEGQSDNPHILVSLCGAYKPASASLLP